MTVFFKKAQRKNAKLRLAIAGPTGSGKTMAVRLQKSLTRSYPKSFKRAKGSLFWA